MTLLTINLSSAEPGALARVAAAVLVACLTGCGTTSVRPTPDATAPTLESIPPSSSAAPLGDGVARFEVQRLQEARLAESAGRLAEAAVAWEVLSLLRPGHADYLQRATAARQAVDQAVVQRLTRAQAVRQKGDNIAAERLFLDVLALEPTHVAAASALREIEAERNRASVVGRFAQPPNLAARNGKNGAAPAPASPMARGSTSPSPSQATTGQRNQLEHASLLAGQGELDAAISHLLDAGGAKPKDPETRQMLARLLAQRGEQRASRDPKNARADMERALDLDPGLKETRARLQALPR